LRAPIALTKWREAYIIAGCFRSMMGIDIPGPGDPGECG